MGAIDFQSSDVRADTSSRSDDVREADSATIPVKEHQLTVVTVGKRKDEAARVSITMAEIEMPTR